MYFVAGLLVAGLAAMLVLPAFWRRALRLAARQARLQAPLSFSEAVAERDQLRAEQAVKQRRLERRIEDFEEAIASHRAELGREAKRVVALETLAGERHTEIGGLRAELAAKLGEVLSLEGDLGASRIALHDLTVQVERATTEISALRDARLALEARADEQRTLIAVLETRAAGLEVRLADQAAAMTKTEAKLASALRDSQVARERLTEAEARLVAEQKAHDQAIAEKARLDGKGSFPAATAPKGAEDGAALVKGEQDSQLREAISRLGAEVLRLIEQKEDEPSFVPKLDFLQRGEPLAATSPNDNGENGEVAPRRTRTILPAP